MSRTLKALAIFAAFVVIVTLSRHSTAPSTTSTTSTASPTSSSTTTTTTTTLKPVGTTCVGSDFNGVFDQGEGAAGTVFASVVLTKTSSGSCRVDGYPLLTLQDKMGAILTSKTLDVSPVEFPAAQANQPAKSQTIRFGATLAFSLGYSDVPVGTEVCGAATTLSVQFTVSGSDVTVTPVYPLEPCNHGTVWVSPFYSLGS